MALTSLSAATSAVALCLGWMADFPLPGSAAAREWVQIGGVLGLILAHFASVVGFTSTLLYGLVRTGDDGAVIVKGRRFRGLRLGLVYLLVFGSPWLVQLLFLLPRL